jgi:hypothetical protein
LLRCKNPDPAGLQVARGLAFGTRQKRRRENRDVGKRRRKGPIVLDEHVAHVIDRMNEVLRLMATASARLKDLVEDVRPVGDPIPRKRGRPRKATPDDIFDEADVGDESFSPAEEAEIDQAIAELAAKRRRPRKRNRKS